MVFLKKKKSLLKKKDPTWLLEIRHFINLVKLKKNNFNKYSWINKQLLSL